MLNEVDEDLARLDVLSQRRTFIEKVWNDVSRTSFPTSESMLRLGSATSTARNANFYDDPIGSQRTKSIYDSVGIVASERLSSGLESLITPQAERWHSFASSADYDDDVYDSAEAQEWMDKLRDYLFECRYDPQSGFPLSNQRCIRSMVGFGQGVMFVEEAFTRLANGRSMPIVYQYIPLAECYLDTNDQGVHDTLYRLFSLTALQLYKKFGDKVSNVTKNLADKANTADTMVEVVHCVHPAGEYSKESSQNNGSEYKPDTKAKGRRWVSRYIEKANRHKIAEGGFFEFPFVVYPWAPIDGSAYAEGPAMLALAELKSLQAMGRDALLASQLGIRPPLASAYSPDVPVNLNPGSVNPKMVDPQTGRILIQPILPAPNPSLMFELLNFRQMQVKDSMYLNLFQTMANAPQMSATEAMIRAQEKGEFLGPTASRIQAALSRLVDREIAILERKGAFREGSKLAPPDDMRNKTFNVRFSAPVDRLRKASDVVGIARTIEMTAQLAQIDPDVVDNIDADETFDIIRQRLGAPRKIMRKPEEVEEIRDQKTQRLNAQAALAGANSAADTAQKGAAAVPGIQQLMQNYGAGGGGLSPGGGGLPGIPNPSPGVPA